MKLIDWGTYSAQQFLYYILTRNRVWAQKEIYNTPQDYSGDHTLEQFKFMNIWRELDAFSRKEIEYMRNHENIEDQLIHVLLGRYTLDWQTAYMLRHYLTDSKAVFPIAEFKQRSMPIVGDAIQFEPSPGKDILATLKDYADAIRANFRELCEAVYVMSAVNFFHYLQYKLPMLGAFRAYEVVTSLTYSENLDWVENDLVYVGDGAVPGVQYVTGRKFDYHEMPAVVMDMQKEVHEKLVTCEDFVWIPAELQGKQSAIVEAKFTYRTMEDCLCEFRKYWEHNKGYRHHRRPRVKVEAPQPVESVRGY